LLQVKEFQAGFRLSLWLGGVGTAFPIISSRHAWCQIAKDAIKRRVGFRMCLGICRAAVTFGGLRARSQELSTRRHLGEKKRPSEEVPAASLPLGPLGLSSFDSTDFARTVSM
jgi:hypothetical protein